MEEQRLNTANLLTAEEARIKWKIITKYNDIDEEFFRDNEEEINLYLNMNVTTFKQYQKIMKSRNI